MTKATYSKKSLFGSYSFRGLQSTMVEQGILARTAENLHLNPSAGGRQTDKETHRERKAERE